METLGLFPLSVILSFVSETDGSVALLLTQRRYARHVLPLFRLPSGRSAKDEDLVIVGSGVAHKQQRHQNRHCFVVVPVQDPVVLLERLNTRRLAQRGRTHPSSFYPAPHGLSTTELALKEWNEQLYPSCCKLELLRFADRTTRLQDAHCQALYEAGTTLLVSYPRSGNTLVRTLLERTTGIVTGSDTRPDRSLSKELAEQHGLVGEGQTQQSLCGCFVKSHWPERTGNRPVQGRRAVLLVRNPYDALDSYWNMNATKSHTQTLAPCVYQQFQDQWQGLVRNEMHVWMKFLDFWIRDCPVPVLLVRYEDLIRDPAHQLTRIMEFVLGSTKQKTTPPPPPPNPSLSSSEEPALDHFWRQRIARAVSSSNHNTKSNTEQLGSYQPRSSGGGGDGGSGMNGSRSVGKSLRRGHYSAQLLDYMHQTAAAHPYTNYLRALGYDMMKQGFPNNFVNAASGSAVGTTSPVPSLLNYALMQSTSDTVRLNDRANEDRLVRPVDCPYGRLLQKWRHSVTDNDTVPLPTE